MDNAFRIIQLSDCHVSAVPGALYRGVDARRAFAQVVEAALRWRPELFLLSGDLSEDFSEASYAFLAGILAETGVPVVTTPGNHDHAGLQAAHFPATATHSARTVEAGSWQLIILNSSVDGEVPGRLSEATLAGLAQALAASHRPKLIVLHHQPVPVGSHWIDRYPLLEAGEFWSALENRPDVRGVLWGHIHHAYREKRDGILLLGAPSTVANSLPFRREFTPDPAGPGCRWLKLAPDGGLATGVLRSCEGFSVPIVTAGD